MSDAYHLVAKEEQRPDEQVVRAVDVSPWGDDPSSVTTAVYRVDKNSSTAVTNDVVDGSASVSGNVITTPTVENLTDGKRYHLELTFALGSNPALQVYWDITCTDNRPPAA